MGEVYLREDISCGFPGCLSCKGNARTGTPLNSSREFFTLPSSAKVIELFGAQFWEECARDVVLCKSVETRAREKFNSNPRLMRAMRGVYEDARKDGFLFDDVHCRKVREIRKKRGCSLVEATATFYGEKFKTLGLSKPKIVVLTTKTRTKTNRLGEKNDLVMEMHAFEYIQRYHPEDEALMLKVQAALEGVANSTIIVGQMRVDSSRTSAVVNNSIRIDSKVKMNRALHLDMVAVDVNTNAVVHVVSRKQMVFTCVLDEKDADDSRLAQRNSVLVVPRESRKLPRFKMLKKCSGHAPRKTILSSIFFLVERENLPGRAFFKHYR